MKLLRTLAMAAAFAGAAAEDSASPPPPSATTATPSPATTTASPAPTNTTSTPTASTPTAPVATTSFDAADGFTKIQLSSGVKSAKFTIENNVTSVSNADTTPLTTETKPLMRVELVEPNSIFQLQGMANDELDKLEINCVTSSAEPAKVELASFSNLTKLTSLSFSNIQFVPSAVTITAPPTLSYLKIANSIAENVELTNPSNDFELKKIDFPNNTFAQLPLMLYQRTYAIALEITGKIAFSSNLTDLSALEYANARNNLQSWSMISFRGNCSDVSTTSGNSHWICQTANRTGIRTLSTDNFVTSTPSSASTAAPSPSATKKRDSANTTLTVIVVVISVIAVVLAFLVARRYFWSSSRSSRSPRLNERTVGLISKDESHATQGKLSFISGDDTLRPMRLEPQEVTITKSVGAAKLWIGDYQGRKVIIKRVEAESNDSYATKALITQAKGLATLKHPSVVGMVGVAWVQGTDFGVVAEFMEKGTLKSILMDLDSDLDLQNKLHMCLDIAQAMLYLHSNERNMYIKQLSSRKVLVNNAIECKVNLFECHSCSAKVELPEVFGAGMLAWEAPEVVTRSGVLNPRKMNIFSLGVLICEIMTRVSPYQSEIDEIGHTRADLELLKRIRRQEKLLPHENRREFTELPVAVRDLVERCLSYQPLLRPTAEEVVQILESAKGYSERFGSTTSL